MPAAKRKIAPKGKVATRTPRSKEVPINEIALEAQRRLGWDPRITDFIEDERKLRIIMDRENKLFTPQHPDMTKSLEAFGYKLIEVGALADEKTLANRRIVKLTRLTPEPVAE